MKRFLWQVFVGWLDFDPDDPALYPATGSPEFGEGDPVIVVEGDLREVLGTAIGTVMEVADQSGGWEYRVEIDGPDSWIVQRHPDLERGHWLSAEQLDRIAE
jgi:hypothetical protein